MENQGKLRSAEERLQYYREQHVKCCLLLSSLTETGRLFDGVYMKIQELDNFICKRIEALDREIIEKMIKANRKKSEAPK